MRDEQRSWRPSSRAKRDVDQGLVPSAQVAVARNGKVAGLRTFGDATDDTLYCIFSCTKVMSRRSGCYSKTGC
jgi:CubicO group peptidase (beta-lactamase class C family)